jgi:hypothetical protein
MDIVMLPRVLPTDEVGWAIRQLRERKRAGVVRHNTDDTYTLFYLSDLGRARTQKLSTMEQVPNGSPVVLLNSPYAAKYALDLVRPTRTAQAYEGMLADLGLSYAVAGETADTVMVVTEHESQTAALSTGGYECTGTPTHYFPQPMVSVGDACPLSPECDGPDGAQPTIRPIS